MRTLDPQSLTQHVDRLYRAAWALCGSREDAEDLVQETFARVLSRPRVLRGDDELYYLMRVLRNTFLTSLRTASRRPVTVAAIEDVIAADPRPTGRPEQALEVKEVYATIAELPEDFRLALVAVDVLGLSYREAAARPARARGDAHHAPVPGPQAGRRAPRPRAATASRGAQRRQAGRRRPRCARTEPAPASGRTRSRTPGGKTRTRAESSQRRNIMSDQPTPRNPS